MCDLMDLKSLVDLSVYEDDNDKLLLKNIQQGEKFHEEIMCFRFKKLTGPFYSNHLKSVKLCHVRVGFIWPLVEDSEHWRVSHSIMTLPSPRSTKMVKASAIDYLLYNDIQREVQEIYHLDFRIWQELQFKLMWRLNRGDLTTLLSFTGVGHAMFNEKQERPDLTKLVCTNRNMQYFVFEKQVREILGKNRRDCELKGLLHLVKTWGKKEWHAVYEHYEKDLKFLFDKSPRLTFPLTLYHGGSSNQNLNDPKQLHGWSLCSSVASLFARMKKPLNHNEFHPTVYACTFPIGFPLIITAGLAVSKYDENYYNEAEVRVPPGMQVLEHFRTIHQFDIGNETKYVHVINCEAIPYENDEISIQFYEDLDWQNISKQFPSRGTMTLSHKNLKMLHNISTVNIFREDDVVLARNFFQQIRNFEPTYFTHDSYEPPLSLVAKYNSENIIRMLVQDFSCNVNSCATIKEKSTALHVAAWHGNSKAAKALLELGADKDFCNLHGQTALAASVHGFVDYFPDFWRFASYYREHCLYWLPNRKKGNDRSQTQTLAVLGLNYGCHQKIDGSFQNMETSQKIIYEISLDQPV